MLFWSAILLLSPVWIPLVVIVTAAILLLLCAVVFILTGIVAFCLAKVILAFLGIYDYVVSVRADVKKKVLVSEHRVSWFRLVFLYLNRVRTGQVA